MNSSRVGAYGILFKNQKLCVVQLHGLYHGYIHLPGGGVEFGEHPIQTLQREWHEEVGIHIIDARLITNISALYKAPSNNGICSQYHNIGMIYEIVQYTQESAGEREPEWYTLDQLENKPLSPLLKAYLEDEHVLIDK